MSDPIIKRSHDLRRELFFLSGGKGPHYLMGLNSEQILKGAQMKSGQTDKRLSGPGERKNLVGNGIIFPVPLH